MQQRRLIHAPKPRRVRSAMDRQRKRLRMVLVAVGAVMTATAFMRA